MRAELFLTLTVFTSGAICDAATPWSINPRVARAPKPALYTRAMTRSDGKFEMQTAAQRLVAEGKPTIWLVGVVHVGTRSYYAALQRLLGYSDAVFFEGVRSEAENSNATNRHKKASSKEAITFYDTFSKTLGLDFQPNDIDYTRPGWTNVDLTIEDFKRINAARTGGKNPGFDELMAMLTPGSPQAKEFAEEMKGTTPGMREAFKMMMIKLSAVVDTPDPSTAPVVLTARNKVVVEALKSAFDQPHPPRSIDVFYGAGHLPDLEHTLVEKFGYRLDERRWFTSASADPRRLGADGKAILAEFDKVTKNLPRPKNIHP